MIEVLLYIVVLLLGIPSALILNKLCKEEIKNWRKRFFIFSIICLISILIFAFTNFSQKIPVIISLFFMIVVFLTLIWKSYKLHKLY